MSGTFQIHDGTFGRALYEAETGRDALLDYLADRRKGELRSLIAVGADGAATITVDGETLTTREIS